jgi:hypothetical protein
MNRIRVSFNTKIGLIFEKYKPVSDKITNTHGTILAFRVLENMALLSLKGRFRNPSGRLQILQIGKAL